jgi:hypothetical protein
MFYLILCHVPVSTREKTSHSGLNLSAVAVAVVVRRWRWGAVGAAQIQATAQHGVEGRDKEQAWPGQRGVPLRHGTRSRQGQASAACRWGAGPKSGHNRAKERAAAKVTKVAQGQGAGEVRSSVIFYFRGCLFELQLRRKLLQAFVVGKLPLWKLSVGKAEAVWQCSFLKAFWCKLSVIPLYVYTYCNEVL